MKRKEPVFLIMLAVILLGLYWRTFRYDFIWDSRVYLGDNASFFEKHTLLDSFRIGFLRSYSEPESTYYRPLVTLSFMLEHRLWGLHNWSLRLVNVLIFFLSLVFLYYFFRRERGEGYFAEITVLLFAVNPLNVDNIVWIVSRCDLFMLLGLSASFYFLSVFMEKGEKKYLALSSLGYLLSLLSKESAVFALPVLFLYDFLKRRKLEASYHLVNVALTAGFFFLKNSVMGVENLRTLLYASFGKNVLTLLAGAGYYFRSLLFPFKYDMFLPTENLMTWKYAALGVLFAAGVVFLVFKARRDSSLWIPLSLIVFFTAGHLMLLFTLIFPYKVYSRYMMVPALGLSWILARALGVFKERLRFGLAFLLILFFIPSLILSSLSYRNELQYFQRARASAPNDDFVNYQLAKLYHEKNDNLTSEIYLNKALSQTLRRQNAILVSLLYAKIEFLRADYEKTLKWVGSIENFERMYLDAAPFIRFQIGHFRAMIDQARGDIAGAERAFQAGLEAYPNIMDSYVELHRLYLGQERWGDAQAVQELMARQFGSAAEAFRVDKIRTEFEASSPREKITFYIAMKNYSQAANLIRGLADAGFEDTIRLALCLYRMGKEAEGKKLLEDTYQENSGDFTRIDSIGSFYLMDLLRAGEAVSYFEKSLDLNPDQPKVKMMAFQLRENYLKKIKNPWG